LPRNIASSAPKHPRSDRVQFAVNRIEKRLLEILGRLPADAARQLLEYAEFLSARHGLDTASSEPLAISRPEQESVVRAIKRLRATYPMLDPTRLLNETSILMSEHVIRGKDAVEVIDELEVLFRTHYEKLTREGE
jgi:hypothetical protein